MDEINTTSEYMTIEEAAALWKVRPERLIYTCDCGGVKGAAKLSNQWIIPAGIPRPVIKQIPHPPTKPSEENGERTRKQQALIDAFDKEDTVPFSVTEHRIGNTTYTVTSCYSKKATRTFAEIIFSMFLRDLEREGHLKLSVPRQQELIKEFRKNEVAKQPSFPEYVKSVENMLVKMEFSENDISMLLDKYVEAYRPLEERK